MSRLSFCAWDSRYDVAVVGVRQADALQDVFVTSDYDVADGVVHELTSAGEASRIEVGTVCPKVAEDLVKNEVTSFGLAESG